MIPLFHRLAPFVVAVAAVAAAAWALLFAVPELLNRHGDGALAAAVAIVVAVPSGLVWGAVRLRHLLTPEDNDDV